MDLRKLKDKASEAFTKGKFAKAAEAYEECCLKDPKDHQVRLRLGDAYAKSGNKVKAIEAYRVVAESFAREGFLPRAIAASKLILELDPQHTGVQQTLADLYSRKGVTGPGRPPGVSTYRSLSATSIPVAPATAAPATPGPAAASAVQTAPTPPAAVPAPPVPAPQVAPMAFPPPARPTTASASFIPLAPSPLAPSPLAPSPLAPVEPPRPRAAPPSMASTDLAAVIPTFELLDEPAPVAVSVPVSTVAPPGLRPKTSVAAPAPKPISDLRAAATRFDEIDLDVESSWQPEASPPPPPARPAADSFEATVAAGGSLLHAVESAARQGLAAETADAVEEEIVFDLPPAIPDALPQIPLFSDLPPEAFVALFERCPLLRRAEGEAIFEQGSQGDSFYVVCAGRVAVLRADDGARRELAVLEEGAFFGEMAILSGAPRSATVLSRSEETQLLEISGPILAELSAEHPQVAQALRKFCRGRLLANLMSFSPLFRSFAKKDRHELVRKFRAREVSAGAAVIRELAAVDGLYVVLCGEMEVSKDGQVLARLKEGEVFGEMSLLTKSPASATVQATRPTSLLRLPRKDFDELMSSHPQILALVSELTDDRKRQNEAVLSGAAMVGDEGVMLL